MSDGESLPSYVTSASTVPLMIEAVDVLKETDRLEAVPHIARIDRMAPGWIRILISGTVSMTLSFIILTLNIMLLKWALPVVCDFVAWFVVGIRPGIWAGDTGIVSQVIDERVYTFGTISLLLVAAYLVYRSPKSRNILKEHEFWPDESQPPIGVRVPLHTIEVVVFVTMVIFVGSAAALALLPIAYFLLDLWAGLNYRLDQLRFVVPLLREFWRWVLVVVGLFVLLIYSMRETPRQTLVKQIVYLCGFLGFGNLLATMLKLEWSEDWILLVMGVPLVYPIGAAFPLSSFFYWPFKLFRNSLYTFYRKVFLRMDLGRAIRDHRSRNRKQTGGDYWSTVCREHFLRFENRQEPISYYRNFTYSCCPKCNDDRLVYNSVECIAMKFDKDMNVVAEQVGPALYLNWFKWQQDTSLPPIPPYDAIVVSNVKDHDIESYVLSMTENSKNQNHRSLAQLPVRIETTSNIADNELHMLEDNAGQVISGYDLEITPNPCIGNIRIREAVQQRARNLRLAAVNVLRYIMILIALILVGLAILYRETVSFYLNELIDWAESFLSYAGTQIL